MHSRVKRRRPALWLKQLSQRGIEARSLGTALPEVPLGLPQKQEGRGVDWDRSRREPQVLNAPSVKSKAQAAGFSGAR